MQAIREGAETMRLCAYTPGIARLRAAPLGAALLAAVLLGAPRAANAQPFQGVYVNLGAGYDLVPDSGAAPPSGFSGSNVQLRRDDGFAGLGSFGYAFGNGFRLELEGSYRQNGLNGLTGTTSPTSATGTIQNYGVMTNLLFDMDIGQSWLYPYLGGGVGYGWDRLSGARLSQAGTSFSSTDSAGGFAYQAIAGLSFPVSGVPGLSVTAEYRYHSVVGDETFHGTTPSGTASLSLGTQHDHDFMLGVRYAFGVTPPPMPTPVPTPAAAAAPAPAPARSYLVFFDWDKATLTPRAQQIIKQAADNSTTVKYTRIEVNGYTDTSGTPQYNQGLSVRRAQAVAAELVKDGVPQGAIAIQGFGETHLLVPTGPGVREPQNRRVEIIIR
jgi:opacity protein-like surface antigen